MWWPTWLYPPTSCADSGHGAWHLYLSILIGSGSYPQFWEHKLIYIKCLEHAWHSMCLKHVGYYYSKRKMAMGRRLGRVLAPHKIGSLHGFLQAKGKAQRFCIPTHRARPPNPSASVSLVKGLFYSLSSLPKTFGLCTREEIWNLRAAISRNSKLLLQGSPCNSP